MWFSKLKHWFLANVIIRRVARNYGVLDPISLLTSIRKFAQPSEVTEPGELVRAGMVFHARGLVNRAIQFNSHWVWPYWVQRQFDRQDPSFIPTSFALTHVNLTHRNWTAVGQPDFNAMPLVDPRGLVTPFRDKWSLDAWVVDAKGNLLAPGKQKEARQQLLFDDNLHVTTSTSREHMELHTEVDAVDDSGRLVCRLRARARSKSGGWLAVGLRPFNPEGISFIHEISMNPSLQKWTVDKKESVVFLEQPEEHSLSNYRNGDVADNLQARNGKTKIECDVGMATGCAFFKIPPGGERKIDVWVPMEAHGKSEESPSKAPSRSHWKDALAPAAQLKIPDPALQKLFDTAMRTLVLHSPDENCYPGPYTYKRFWFRDAAYIVDALLSMNLVDRGKRVLDSYPRRQSPTGYFLSQEGEWDSNGEALWVMERWMDLTGEALPDAWLPAIKSAARWIHRKRSDHDSPHKKRGLFPAGFSAEHLGLNDFYYWDNFWGVAGLRAASRMLEKSGRYAELAEEAHQESQSFQTTIEDYLKRDRERLGRSAMPAAPGRRLDGGSIGSLVAAYPLEVIGAEDDRPQDTARYLLEEFCESGAFFHQMTHAGYNAYLTLHIAQILLRAGKPEFFEKVQAVARLASPTGQWPEAIHPRTLGGCMGDGQHVWAASEWLLMMRALFLYEDRHAKALILGAGLQEEWLQPGAELAFGQTPTPWGPVTVQVRCSDQNLTVSWDAQWRGAQPTIHVRLPGFPQKNPNPQDGRVQYTLKERTS